MKQITTPSLVLSILPVLFLTSMIGSSVYLFGDETIAGPGQIALILAGVLAGLVGIICGHKWESLEKGVSESIKRALPAIFILLMVGTLIAMWMFSGTIPYLIYYGLQILVPEIFFLAAVLISALVSISIGSSWTTAGTVGIALVGIATASGLSPAMTAGAVISGAYFGDKLSPLSDTTNLAAAVTETQLFEHIKFLLWTTLPAMGLAMVFFTYQSITSAADIDQTQIQTISASIKANYWLGPILLLPLFVTLGLAVNKQPAFTSLLLGALTAGIIGLFVQGDGVDIIELLMHGNGIGALGDSLKQMWLVAANGFSIETGNAALDKLLSRGGMESMLNTVWLILSAMFFGGMMEKSGALGVIVQWLLIGVETGGGLMRRAGLTAFAMNFITSDQFLSIALPARMYAEKFTEMKLASKNLSRVVEDYGTVTSVLVPWNTCGAFMAVTLGVATTDYFYLCIFNLSSPIISYIYAVMNFKVAPLEIDHEATDQKEVTA